MRCFCFRRIVSGSRRVLLFLGIILQLEKSSKFLDHLAFKRVFLLQGSSCNWTSPLSFWTVLRLDRSFYFRVISQLDESSKFLDRLAFGRIFLLQGSSRSWTSPLSFQIISRLDGSFYFRDRLVVGRVLQVFRSSCIWTDLFTLGIVLQLDESFERMSPWWRVGHLPWVKTEGLA